MKYCVTVAKTGMVFVDAQTKEEAVEIAEHQLTDNIWWLDDYQATDVQEDDSALNAMYVSKPAY